MPPKVLFLGSGRFAVPSLRALTEIGISPLVITKPDKPAGRGRSLKATPVKEAALELGLEALQPEGLKDPALMKRLQNENPDLILSIAYGEYIPPELLKLPKKGCLNLHPSLLPKYRGAAPVQRALMAGETQTGITLAYVVEQWDSGDILMQEPYPIDPADNAGTLLEKLSADGAALLKKAIPEFLEGKLKAAAQDPSKATYAPKIKEIETWIDWARPAEQIFNFIRGLSPEPGAKTRFRQSFVKIREAGVFPGNATPGFIVEIREEGPMVAAGTNCLLLKQVQSESRAVMSGKDFANGYRLQTGQSFQG